MSRRDIRAGTAVLGVLVVFAVAGIGVAQSPEEPPLPFQATAAASGVNVRLVLPGAPLTDTLVDAGGPTAQAQNNSSGSGTSFAAFPFPGDIVITAPGLAAGLLGLGAAGLPPIPIPTLPSYPLQVVADPVNPTRSIGSGPYHLEARVDGVNGSAEATGGLQNSPAGNIALVTSTAEITADAARAVATAVSDVQAITVGPLAIADVTSTARMTVGEDGVPKASSTFEIAGLRIAGVPVAVNGDGLNLAGVPVPLPLNDTLSQILSAAGVTAEFLPERRFADRVIGASLELTFPVDGSAAGAGQGTMTVTVGGATASMLGTAPDVPVDAGTGSGGVPPVVSGTGLDGSLGAPVGIGGVSSPGTGVTPGSVTPAAATGEVNGLFDIRSLYALLAACAIGVWVLAQLVRIVGVRGRWASTAG